MLCILDIESLGAVIIENTEYRSASSNRYRCVTDELCALIQLEEIQASTVVAPLPMRSSYPH